MSRQELRGVAASARLKAVERAATALRARGTTEDIEKDLCTYTEYGQIVGLSRWLEIGESARDSG